MGGDASDDGTVGDDLGPDTDAGTASTTEPTDTDSSDDDEATFMWSA